MSSTALSISAKCQPCPNKITGSFPVKYFRGDGTQVEEGLLPVGWPTVTGVSGTMNLPAGPVFNEPLYIQLSPPLPCNVPSFPTESAFGDNPNGFSISTDPKTLGLVCVPAAGNLVASSSQATYFFTKTACTHVPPCILLPAPKPCVSLKVRQAGQ